MRARAAPTHPGAQPEQHGGLPWPQQPASALPKVEDLPRPTTRHNTERDDWDDDLAEQAAIEFKRVMDEVSKISVLATTMRLLLLWAPPVTYVLIFLPCWECYDFEAAASHEVGHALGLMHPDQAAPQGTNLMWNGLAAPPAPPAPCDDPWSVTTVRDPNATVLPSIMLAFTQFNKDVCLSQDDLDALNTLYPICTNRVLTPQCYKTESYIGIVRIAVFIGLPVAVLMAVILCARWWKGASTLSDDTAPSAHLVPPGALAAPT